MASTVKRIEELAEQTVRDLTDHPGHWLHFLSSASRIYLYPFTDQLLIYAQRPDATACASMDIWNRRMNCRIRRGSVGIALIDDQRGYRKLRYVFDVSDTVKLPEIGKEPQIWEYPADREEEIARHLRSEFMLSGQLDSARGLTGVITAYALEQAESLLDDLKEDLKGSMDGSRASELDAERQIDAVRRMVVLACVYTMTQRCGIDGVFSEEDFSLISRFNTLPALSVIGGACQEICSPFLKEIGRYLRTYPVIGPDPVAKRREELYNEFNTLKRESKKEEADHGRGHEIYPGGRSDDSGPDDRPGADRHRQIRLDAQEVSSGAQEGHLLGDDPAGNSEPVSPGSERADKEQDRGTGDGNGEERSWAGQGSGSDGLGETSEQPAAAGGGDGSSGDDLQLRKQEEYIESDGQMSLFAPSGVTFPGEAQQTHLIYENTHRSPVSDERVEDILRTGGGKRGSLFRICAALIKGAEREELSGILRDEYGSGGKGFTFDGQRMAVWFDENGMRFALGDSARENADRSLRWEEITERISRLYEEGDYVPSVVSAGALDFERREVASSLYYLLRDGLGKLPDQWRNAEHAFDQIADVLKDREKAGKLAVAYTKTKERMVADGRRGGYFLSHCDRCLERLFRLSRPDRRIAQNHVQELPALSFITMDEVDEVLRRGSGYEHGKIRIYRFFTGNDERQAAADFLRKEYGTGGSSSALPGADSFVDYDGKGISITKGQITKPAVKVLLRWNKAAERIRQLIREEAYLTEEEMLLYQREEEERRLEEEEAARRQEEAAADTAEDTQEEILTPERVTVGIVAADAVMRVAAGNYHINNDTIGNGGPKEKFARNIAAITLLKSLEEANLPATKEDQEILAGYVGWGGLADAFDPDKENWRDEYNQLKELLADEEYALARGSVLNAHYTQPVIIRAMYEALARMGFQRGNILEPSMGIGHFFGMLPESMQGARLFGVELDEISGRIAKLLYPEAEIRIEGYEKSRFPNDFFDVAIGNVPFGNYSVNDRSYNNRGFLIHDYFLAKTIDQLRPGGVMAFITTKGTMDKENDSVRRYLSERAELLGAIRLPNDAFYQNAGTRVTSDILFFQKRDTVSLEKPDWLRTETIRSEKGNAVPVNAYFAAHPEMILGKMEMISGPYGMESACLPLEGENLAVQLGRAIEHIHGSITARTAELEDLESDEELIPADPSVRNYSYAVVDDRVYYRENSLMRPVTAADTVLARIKGCIGIRDSVRRLIDLQMDEHAADAMIKEGQRQLNTLYDSFTKEYGLINSGANKRAFSEDSSYCLLCSLEILREDGTLERKADMFYRRTIKKPEPVSFVETSQEALIVSLNERAKVDLPFMAQLTGKDEEAVASDLSGEIFLNPATGAWENADEYLSGNVREKLKLAKTAALRDPKFRINEESLLKVIPKDLDASQIEVRLGASWIEPADYMAFMEELLHTPSYLVGRTIDIQYSPVNGLWNISGKNADSYHNILVTATYGTERMNAYYILEQSKKKKNVQVFDVVEEDGKEKRVLNRKETMLAGQKQDAMKEAFREWIFKDPKRRERLCRTYNDRFNAFRPREYDGSHLPFPGMNPELELRPHQKNAVAHQLFGGNTLLAHVVGAGKTYEMVAAAMEGKRLGLCQKSLFVVPNHLTGQWGAEFLQLYPGANILVATKKDFEPANRKKFCGRIALGNYDAVIIGHSQFEKIPLSLERQKRFLTDQIDEITDAIAASKWRSGERFSVKEMEKTRKSLQARLEKLSEIKQDDVVTFEQLGVDHLYVDEAHYYKNAFLYTKMRNVAGISQTEAMKSSDMLNKCRYMDEITGGRGITFATGTPISNSMTELYIMQRYLQRGRLKQMGLDQFDGWASTFGEVVTAVELAPEGTGYRIRSRFAKFYNIPELMSLFKEIADIKTADQLALPVPKAVYETVVLPPSDMQREIVSSLAERAEKVRSGGVDSSEDNMLKITNDGRKLALDQRLVNPLLPDDPGSKVHACAGKCRKIWEETKDQRLTQLVFCDLSTPKENGEFNVYADLKKKLTGLGIPEKEIAYIHDAKTDAKKAELFAKVRSGQVRILIGSTSKMGAGTNVQDKLIALHHLDIGWKPSDLEQREGRIIRQGNSNDTVQIYRYVTENTFDSYMWQLIESKQKFISQIMTSKAPVRSCEDVDETALSYAEVKALAAGNPEIKEKMELDVDVTKLKLLRSNFKSNLYRLEDEIARVYPGKIAKYRELIRDYGQDLELLTKEREKCGDAFSMIVMGTVYTEKKEAGSAVIALCSELGTTGVMETEIGNYLGFTMALSYSTLENEYLLSLKGKAVYRTHLGKDAVGIITRVNNVLDTIPKSLTQTEEKLKETEEQLEVAKTEITKPFPREEEYQEKTRRLAELNAKLSLDEPGDRETDGESLVAEKQEAYCTGVKAKAI